MILLKISLSMALATNLAIFIISMNLQTRYILPTRSPGGVTSMTDPVSNETQKIIGAPSPSQLDNGLKPTKLGSGLSGMVVMLGLPSDSSLSSV